MLPVSLAKPPPVARLKEIAHLVLAAWILNQHPDNALDPASELGKAVIATGVDEIAVADTIGVADPWAVTERIDAISTMTGDLPLRVHFHDTRNTGIANTYAAIQAGVRVVDASVGGIGGCPFAPAATGNIPTDDLVYMLDRAGFSHGLSLDALIGVSGEVADALGKDVPAMLPRAGGFP